MIRLTATVSMALVLAGTAGELWAAQGAVLTDRPTYRTLPLPRADDVFHFVVFGDRTGGPAEGIEVLRRAVADTNLLGPDLVMTVGDLIQGYNRRPQWLVQMREFRAVMDRLRMPWFPVAGNHDTYWGNNPDRPRTEHDSDYEAHFGPLWYAFPHKDCWFVVLYTDEGDPQTGKKSFRPGPAQQMSDAQLGWLRRALAGARTARHVFVFLHHPRWIEDRYGEGWSRVHAELRAAGNVRAVFAGHIHRQHYAGPRDGIEYFAAATVGGHLNRDLPVAGYLHHLLVVTVRDRGIQVASIPVGSVTDPRVMTSDLTGDLELLASDLQVVPETPLVLDDRLGADATLTLSIHNPASRPVELDLSCDDPDATFAFQPNHLHLTLAAGVTGRVSFRVERQAQARDPWFRLPELQVRCDYLAETARYALPGRTVPLPVVPTVLPEVSGEGALHLDGRSALQLASERLVVDDGPFTIEAWVCGEDYRGRRGLVNKTEGAELGLFVSDGRPSLLVHLDGEYRSASAGSRCLDAGRWQHLAGVFDGSELRLYVDGRQVGAAPASGVRTRNRLPWQIGADPDAAGRPTSGFAGWIDEVRLSTVARYHAGFTPAARHLTDADTALLLHLDGDVGCWVRDDSGQQRHPQRVGRARVDPGIGPPRATR